MKTLWIKGCITMLTVCSLIAHIAEIMLIFFHQPGEGGNWEHMSHISEFSFLGSRSGEARCTHLALPLTSKRAAAGNTSKDQLCAVPEQLANLCHKKEQQLLSPMRPLEGPQCLLWPQDSRPLLRPGWILDFSFGFAAFAFHLAFPFCSSFVNSLVIPVSGFLSLRKGNLSPIFQPLGYMRVI